VISQRAAKAKFEMLTSEMSTSGIRLASRPMPKGRATPAIKPPDGMYPRFSSSPEF
jgi:hypothetical protein